MTAIKTFGWAFTAAVIVAGAVTGGLAVAPHAQARDEKPRAARSSQCVDTRNLESRMIVGKNQIVLQDASGRGALLTMGPPCIQMDDLDRIGFEYEGDSTLCEKHDVTILWSRMDERPLRCIITDMKPLSRDEVKAYSAPTRH